MLADRPWCVLTGAGMSTDSGIPDYRGPDGTRRVTPVTYAEFVRSPAVRARYWARAYAGWHRFRGAEPNAAHRAVAWLERAGVASAVITQNVDRLHQAAGSRAVVDLHGTLERTVCLECGALADRDDVHAQIAARNPAFAGVAEDAARGRVRPVAGARRRTSGRDQRQRARPARPHPTELVELVTQVTNLFKETAPPGTEVEIASIAGIPLYDGDVLTIGRARLRYENLQRRRPRRQAAPDRRSGSASHHRLAKTDNPWR